MSFPRLMTRFDLKGWYSWVRSSGMPVAWCSAFAPAEALLAAGVIPVYPENHAAMLGALSPTKDPSNPWSSEAITRSEAAGHTGPKLCSYARADIGVLLGSDSPIGSLPPPDLFYACDSQCQVVERWGDAVQTICRGQGKEVPHYVLKAPPLRGAQHSEEELAKFSADLKGHVQDICHRFGTPWSEERLVQVTRASAEANALWQQCCELSKQSPSPWTSLEAFQAMAPIVVARGDDRCTAFYADLLKELQSRSRGHTERVRLLWDAIPIWPMKNRLQSLLDELEATLVTSTYTHSWWFHFRYDTPKNAWDSIVERYAWNTMNRSAQWVLDWTLDLVKDYQCDGIIAHWNNSCGIWNSYVKRRLKGYAAAGVPTLRIDADMVDARYIDIPQIEKSITEFVENLKETQYAS